MTQLHYPDVELDGPAREHVLRRCEAQLAEWDVVVPKDFILVLNFGLNEFDRTGLTEYWVANETKAGYCGKFLFLLDRQWCPEHYHKLKHETFYVVKGQVRMVAEGEETLLDPGSTFVMPPGVRHTFQGIGPTLILEVSQPSIRGDNIFTDSRIGRDGVL